MIVTLTPRTDFAPVPRVEIRLEESTDFDGGDADAPGGGTLDGGDAGGGGTTIDGGVASTMSVDIPAGTDRVTVWRRSEGRSFKTRGGIDRVFSGSLGLLDHEIGQQVRSTYEIECWDGTTPLGRVSLGSVTMPAVGDENDVIIQQPLDPKLSVVVTNLAGSWPTITRDSEGESVRTEGSVLPTLIGFGPRQGAMDVALEFMVQSRVAAAQLWATLGTEDRPQLPVWLVRTHQSHLPRVFFCRVKTLVEGDVNLRYGGEASTFRAVVEEIKAPAPGLVVPTLTYSDLAAVFPTYTEMKAALITYSAMATAWEYAGAAG